MIANPPAREGRAGCGWNCTVRPDVLDVVQGAPEREQAFELARTGLGREKRLASVFSSQQLTTTDLGVFLTMLGMIASPACAADTTDQGPDGAFMPFVRALYGYDSNLFRLQNDQEARAVLRTSNTAESYLMLGAGMDANLKMSRQAIQAHVELNQTRFNTYGQLDNDGHDASLKWAWKIGSRATGDISVADTLRQASYANVKEPVKNQIRTRRGGLNGAIQLTHPWQVQFGMESVRTSNDAAAQLPQDATVDALKAGLQYRSDKGSTVGWVSRRSEGRYPNRQLIGVVAVDNDYRQWDNGVAAVWKLSEKTSMTGKLNFTQRAYADVPQRDFSGLTGLLSLGWSATNRTTLSASTYRDIDAIENTAIENTTASYALNQGVAVGADWKPTAKLTFSTRLSHDHIEYTGDPGIALSTQAVREDRLTMAQAGLQYTVLRNTQIELMLRRGVRHSNEALESYRYSSALINLSSHF
ncbi:XrtB/PEP-CTERM-associated polysaccharide biosynthesis outer membrane protein EpsL [Thiobacillus sp.]|uniref:XrtB/PEP-CTERM-associated polysaccharide biosynthesis outer membrane protein EpsL n=1 Tax=Thiobacillus sp. TaxID=924 RepID=UPI00181E46AA|nr:XrtB/PEP-CTERM-associated polysaccharide biosynthesis outer membrane protein EpsL [Thiobacillus sp.]MBC2729374.1 outer membrane beta-barrel protein [Thiobacillus sp.]MBC2738109.1 outer membrane beta-barrel protein [Thiobacillus sp.]MBC2759700.1 outer membrane beta-barrel protein [Thiobacillus sp.]